MIVNNSHTCTCTVVRLLFHEQRVADAVKTDVRPLPDKEREQLKTNLPNLMKMIETDPVVNRLYARGCINDFQREHLQAQKTSHDKNRELVNILTKSSYQDFKTFLDILAETNQGHIAVEVFGQGGGKFLIKS